jgi:drug/metabolite transporter (DMT)-like permease
MFTKIFLLPITFTIHASQAACFKEFSRKYMKNLASYFLYNSLYFIVVVLSLLLLNGGIHSVHPLTLQLSLLQGALFIATTLFYMRAMASGPYSFTILIFSLSLIVPVLAGIFLWHEKISLPLSIGMVLLLVTLYIASRQGAGPSNEKTALTRKSIVRWLALCLIAMLLNGLLMTISKYHQIMMPGKEISEYLILVFTVACLLSVILFFAIKARGKEQSVTHLKNGKFAALTLATGIFCAAGGYLLHYLAGIIPASILYPGLNGGFTIVSAILSVVIFKEKLRVQSVTGLATGLAALVLFSL